MALLATAGHVSRKGEALSLSCSLEGQRWKELLVSQCGQGGQAGRTGRDGPEVSVLQAHSSHSAELIQWCQAAESSKEQDNLFRIVNIHVFHPHDIIFLAVKLISLEPARWLSK